MRSGIEISQSLQSACRFLDPEQDRKLIQESYLVCQQLIDPCFRIAVLAPFNFGKSTLLNAILGGKIMPTKAVRNTGLAIKIKYGKFLQIVITLKSGQVINSSDVKILKDFAVLNKQGYRRDDVVSVEVFYPHPFLKNGIELLDLPGTNDREEQNILVRDQLLQVDLVVQVLNAKQSLTLEEKENLQKWLINRGINTVVFVLNWMNQLETKDDCREVYNDVRSFTDRFKSNLPKDIKNLYRVDAKPAIEAKQKSSIFNFSKTGINRFEAALSTIASLQKQRISLTRLPRVIAIAAQVKEALQMKIVQIDGEIKMAEFHRNSAIENGKEREKILKEGFKNSVSILRNWLSLQSLLGVYQLGATESLKDSQFYNWQERELKSQLTSYIQTIEKWIQQACNDFNKTSSYSLYISFPSQPSARLPQRQDRNAGQWFGDIFNGGANRKKLDEKYEREKWDAYKSATHSYFSEFSRNALNSLNNYENQANSIITFSIPEESYELVSKRIYFNQLNFNFVELKKIEVLENRKFNNRSNKTLKIYIFLMFWKNFLLIMLRTVTRTNLL